MHMLYIVAEEYFYSPLQIQSQNALNFYIVSVGREGPFRVG